MDEILIGLFLILICIFGIITAFQILYQFVNFIFWAVKKICKRTIKETTMPFNFICLIMTMVLAGIGVKLII